MIAENSLWHLIVQTDFMSKVILFVLFSMSIGIWTLFLCKVILLYLKKRDMDAVLAKLPTVITVDEMRVLAQGNHQTLPGYFLLQGMRCIKNIQEDDQKGFISRYADRVDLMRYALEQEIDKQLIREEEYGYILSTSAVISPLIGLLGTVWGLIHAFIGISQTQVADIATVAPGIAEALTTTLAGLLVAIPAVIMVNYISAKIGMIEQQLMLIADHIVRVAKGVVASKRNEPCGD